MRPLFVAATAAEARYLPESAEVLVTGMGKTAAATALTRRLAGYAAGGLGDVQVVNLGTAGALRAGLSGLFEIGSVINHEISADILRALGEDVRERFVVGAAETVLATGDMFVTDAAVRDTLARDAHLVDMEGYAVAYVAAEFGVPVRMVKFVSDAADDSALEWSTVVDGCARVLGEWARSQFG